MDWKLAFRIDELSENQPEMPMFTFRQHQIALSFFSAPCVAAAVVVVSFSDETRMKPYCKLALQARIFCLHDKNQSHWQPFAENLHASTAMPFSIAILSKCCLLLFLLPFQCLNMSLK